MSTMLTLMMSLALAGPTEDIQNARRACAADPAPCEFVDNLVPAKTRAGWGRIHDVRLEDPANYGPLLQRLVSEQDSDMVLSLADAAARVLPIMVDEWGHAYAHVAANHPDLKARQFMLNGLRKAPKAVAMQGLPAALKHEAPTTREDAARNMGGHAEAGSFVDHLMAASSDSDAAVRGAVAKALGYAGDVRGLPTVEGMVRDADGEVRKEALRAIWRIDEARAAFFGEQMLEDPHVAAAREARRVSGK